MKDLLRIKAVERKKVVVKIAREIHVGMVPIDMDEGAPSGSWKFRDSMLHLNGTMLAEILASSASEGAWAEPRFSGKPLRDYSTPSHLLSSERRFKSVVGPPYNENMKVIFLPSSWSTASSLGMLTLLPDVALVAVVCENGKRVIYLPEELPPGSIEKLGCICANFLKRIHLSAEGADKDEPP
jgi:hypothetical protein